LEQQRRSRPEGFEVILRRYFREIQSSGILTEAKKKRFFEKDISRTKRRDSAIRKTARRKIKRGY